MDNDTINTNQKSVKKAEARKYLSIARLTKLTANFAHKRATVALMQKCIAYQNNNPASKKKKKKKRKTTTNKQTKAVENSLYCVIW